MADGLLATTSAPLPEGGPPPKLLDRVRTAAPEALQPPDRGSLASYDWSMIVNGPVCFLT
jgi:hypothetical protein